MSTNLDKALQYLQHFTKISLMILLCMGTIYWIFADKIVALLAGTSIPEAVQVFKIHAFLPAIALLSNTLGLHVLIPLQSGTKYTLSILVAGLLAAGLHVILVPRFQTQGAASAVVLSELFTVGLLSLIAYRAIKRVRATEELGIKN